MFIDRTKIFIASGNGGNGAVSFHREKYVNAGGPDGGDGGKGGDVVFIVDEGASTLADFKYKRKFKAENGANGAKNKMTGKSGADVFVKVPQGTLIRDAETGRILADMVDPGEKKVIAKGGKGGLGNMHFATSTRQIPNFARAGEDGKEMELQLELKLLADVGLAGFPNVGKSTLLSVTTGAKPEIANYHFTTVRPNLGVVFNNGERSYVMADIPGLIEGASEGQGLGHEFLRHIERTRLLIHVIDISGSEGRDPFEDFLLINRELTHYNEALSRRPQIIALNKMDRENAEANAEHFKIQFASWLEQRGEEFREEQENGAWRIFEISAAMSQGTRELAAYCGSILDKMPSGSIFTPEENETVYRMETEEEPFTIRIEDGVFVVEGPWIKNIVDSVNLNDYESSQYFQRIIRKKGLIRKLEEMGIQENDTVRIYEIEFDYYV
ncbi:MAG: GTPase ObgE [Clostridiales bacterium]|jgi:obg family GTPase cgtA|nr:GTPase ObgE [Clostridiales bacterium]